MRPVWVPPGHPWYKIAQDAHIMAEPLKLTTRDEIMHVKSVPYKDGYNLEMIQQGEFKCPVCGGKSAKPCGDCGRSNCDGRNKGCFNCDNNHCLKCDSVGSIPVIRREPVNRQERIEFLRRRIKRSRQEIANTVMRVSEENDLVVGSINNLVHLHADITELKLMIKVHRGEV